jgi:hypothetical protein
MAFLHTLRDPNFSPRPPRPVPPRAEGSPAKIHPTGKSPTTMGFIHYIYILMIIYDVYNIIIGFISFLYMIKHVYIYMGILSLNFKIEPTSYDTWGPENGMDSPKVQNAISVRGFW